MTRRILIVDDDAEILDMLTLSIEIWCPDCRVIAATNGLDALVQLQLRDGIQPFDMLLTDYEMPIMNGLDLAYEVRQKWPNVRIVLMSGGKFEIDVESQVDEYIRKPFMMKQVKDLFRNDSEILH
jgi:YesN/AraC family two-component response regulator